MYLYFSSEVGKATMEEEVHQSKAKEVSDLFPLKKTLLFAINISSKIYKNSLQSLLSKSYEWKSPPFEDRNVQFLFRVVDSKYFLVPNAHLSLVIRQQFFTQKN